MSWINISESEKKNFLRKIFVVYLNISNKSCKYNNNFFEISYLWWSMNNQNIGSQVFYWLLFRYKYDSENTMISVAIIFVYQDWIKFNTKRLINYY